MTITPEDLETRIARRAAQQATPAAAAPTGEEDLAARIARRAAQPSSPAPTEDLATRIARRAGPPAAQVTPPPATEPQATAAGRTPPPAAPPSWTTRLSSALSNLAHWQPSGEATPNIPVSTQDTQLTGPAATLPSAAMVAAGAKEFVSPSNLSEMGKRSLMAAGALVNSLTRGVGGIGEIGGLPGVSYDPRTGKATVSSSPIALQAAPNMPIPTQDSQYYGPEIRFGNQQVQLHPGLEQTLQPPKDVWSQISEGTAGLLGNLMLWEAAARYAPSMFPQTGAGGPTPIPQGISGMPLTGGGAGALQVAPRVMDLAERLIHSVARATDTAIVVGALEQKGPDETKLQHIGKTMEGAALFTLAASALGEAATAGGKLWEIPAMQELRTRVGQFILSSGKAGDAASAEKMASDIIEGEIGKGGWKKFAKSVQDEQSALSQKPPTVNEQLAGYQQDTDIVRRMSPENAKRLRAGETLVTVDKDGGVDTAAQEWIARHPEAGPATPTERIGKDQRTDAEVRAVLHPENIKRLDSGTGVFVTDEQGNVDPAAREWLARHPEDDFTSEGPKQRRQLEILKNIRKALVAGKASNVNVADVDHDIEVTQRRIDELEKPPAAQPAEETVRLYRGESTPGTGKGVPAWIDAKDNPGIQAGRRWFTSDLETAKWYQREAGESGRIVSVDVPKSVWEAAQQAPEVQRYSLRPDEGFIPSEYVEKAKPVQELKKPTTLPGFAPPPPFPDKEAIGAQIDRIRGSADLQPTAKGDQQNLDVGEAFRQAGGVDRIITSPLRRTTAMAQAISNATGAPVETHPDIGDIHYGGLEGQPTKQVIGEINDRFQNRTSENFPGQSPYSGQPGESPNTFNTRLLSVVNDQVNTLRQDPNRRIVMVVNRRPIKTIEGWIAAGAKPDFSVDAKVQTSFGDDTHPGDTFRLYFDKGVLALENVDGLDVHPLPGGIYLVRHAETAWNAPTVAKARPAPITGFKTKLGSTYEVHKDQTTTRNKAPRPEHPGSFGPQPTSHNTFYVTPANADILGEIQTTAPPGIQRQLLWAREGHIGIRYASGKDKGKFERRTVVPYEKLPAIGLTPIETWGNGHVVHFGNPITELTRGGSYAEKPEQVFPPEAGKEEPKPAPKRPAPPAAPEFKLTPPPAVTDTPVQSKLREYLRDYERYKHPDRETILFLEGALEQIEASEPRFAEKNFGPSEAVDEYRPASNFSPGAQDRLRGIAMELWAYAHAELGLKSGLPEDYDWSDPETHADLDYILGRPAKRVEEPTPTDESTIQKALQRSEPERQAARKAAIDKLRSMGPPPGIQNAYYYFGSLPGLERQYADMQAQIDRLALEIDAAYERGDHRAANRMEALVETVEHAMDELNESGDYLQGEGEVTEELLAAAYQDLLRLEKGELRDGRTHEDIIENMRANLARSRGFRADASDEEVIAAAKDSYDRIQRLREKLKERRPGELQKVRDFLNKLSERQGPGVESARAPGGGLKIGMNEEAAAAEMSTGIYGGAESSGTIMKELLQNAVDAVKTTGGSIKVVNYGTPGGADALTVQDSGPGMTRGELETVFTNLFDSGKRSEETASGGKGVAKAAFLLHPQLEQTRVRSVVNLDAAIKDRARALIEAIGGPEEQQIRSELLQLRKGQAQGDTVAAYTVYTTPKELKGAGTGPIDVTTGSDMPTGVRIDEQFKPKVQTLDGRDFLKKASRYIPGNVSLDFYYRKYRAQVVGGLEEELSKQWITNHPGTDAIDYVMAEDPSDSTWLSPKLQSSPVGSFTISGAKVTVQGETGKTQYAQYGVIGYEILNNGLYQFRTGVRAPNGIPVPANLSVDVQPTVPEGDADYPFTTDRERLKQNQISAISDWITKHVLGPGVRDRTAATQAQFDALKPEVEGYAFFDSGAKLSDQERWAMTHFPPVQKMVQLVGDITKEVAQLAGVLDRTPKIGTMLAEHGHLGVSVPDPSSPETDIRWAVLINWLESLHRHYGNPDAAAAEIKHTIIHELAHVRSNDSHTEKFAWNIVEILGKLGVERENSFGETIKAAIIDATDASGYNQGLREALRVYDESRERDVRTPDLIGSTGHRAAGQPPDSGAEGGAAPVVPDSGESRPAAARSYTDLPADYRSALLELGADQYLDTPGPDAWKSEVLAAAGDWVAPYLDSVYTAVRSVAGPATPVPAPSPEPAPPLERPTTSGGPRAPPTETPTAAGGQPSGPTVPDLEGQDREPLVSDQPSAVPEAGGAGATAAAPQPSGGARPPDLGAVPGEGAQSGTGGRTAVRKPRPAAPGTEKPERLTPPDAPPLNANNYRITEADHVGEGGPRQKFRDNINAIQILKDIEKSGRKPSDEERRLLVKYVGWGGLSEKAFAYNNREFYELSNQLRKLLTDEEYAAARRSTLNAHFTAEEVVRFMWALAERMGFKGGVVVEPAAGIGHFIGMSPDAIQPFTHFTGVELDPVTGRIAGLLYPDAKIHVRGYETIAMPDGSVDFFISNVPFGDITVQDPRYKKLGRLRVHDYFFIKSLDKLREGGVMMFITSAGTLDKQDPYVRQLLADRADLVTAYRLPNTAFKGNAGTEVTTDILVLRKRFANEPARGEAFLRTVENADDIRINEYFINHPENLFGKMTLGGAMYRGGEATLEETAPITEHMTRALSAEMPQIFGSSYAPSPALDDSLADIAPDHIKEGSFTVVAGQIKQRINGVLVDPPGDKFKQLSVKNRIRMLVELRDQAKAVIATQMESPDDELLQLQQTILGKLYDAYVASEGYLHGLKTSSVFRADPEYPLLQALEDYNAETQKATKSDIFTKRTIAAIQPLTAVSADPKEGLIQVVAEKGFPDTQLLAKLRGEDEADVVRQLINLDLVYRDPDTGAYQLTETYLSGNIYEKLDAAKLAAQSNDEYKRNVTALQAVIPERVTIHEILAKLGATWIPPGAVEDFLSDKLGIQARVRNSMGQWILEGAASTGADAQWGTGRVEPLELVELLLNQKRSTVRDTLAGGSSVVNQMATLEAREKQKQISDAFQQWVRASEHWAPPLEDQYNRLYNGIRLPTYDGSHLGGETGLPGHRIGYQFRQHQLDAIWRGVMERRMLIGHTVGAGKTDVAIAIGMELRRLGVSKKNMYVVPNDKVEQWRAMFQFLYPAARILAIGREDLAAANRKRSTARIATGDWDAVILQHSSYKKLPISPEWQARTIENELREMVETLTAVKAAKKTGKANRRTVKQLEKAILNRKAKLQELANLPRDNTLNFDQLGIDMLFVDESQEFKNLTYYSKMGQISGLSSSGGNPTSADMKSKTDYMLEKHNNKGVIFMTGTPITNTMAEMYNLTRYVAPEVLENAGIRFFDDWAANFGSVVDVMELSADGRTYKARAKFAQFTNVPEMLRMFRSFADIKMGHDLNLPRPKMIGDAPRVIAVPTNEVIEPLFLELVDRAERLRAGDQALLMAGGWLTLTGDGKKIALDARLYDPTLPDHPDSKSNRAVREIAARYHAGTTSADLALHPNNTTQLVLSENYHLEDKETKRELFNLYRDMKHKLVALGVPEKEIAIVYDWPGDKLFPILQKKMNAGEIRILFGTRKKLGVGLNVQERLQVLHDLDAPWTPAMVEQAHGRIERQGNLNSEIEIIQYVTEQSFDAYIFQALETKARFIAQAMSGNLKARTMDDAASMVILNYATQKAIASGNPDVKLKVDLEAEYGRLDMLSLAFDNERSRRRQALSWTREEIKNLRTNTIPRYEKAVAEYNADRTAQIDRLAPADPGEVDHHYVVNGVDFEPKVDAEGKRDKEVRKALIEYINTNWKKVVREGAILSVDGVPVTLRASSEPWTYSVPELNAKGEATGKYVKKTDIVHHVGYSIANSAHSASGGASVPGQGAESLLTSINYHIRDLPADLATFERQAANKEKDVEQIEHLLATETFGHTDRLAQVRAELAAVNARLQPAPEGPDDELVDPEAESEEEEPESGRTGPPSEEATRRVRKAIDEANPSPFIEGEETGALRLSGNRSVPPPDGIEPFKVGIPEIDARINAADAPFPQEAWRNIIADQFRVVSHQLTRTYEDLPHGARFGPLIDRLNNLKRQWNVARDQAVFKIYGYTVGLSPRQLNDLKYKILLDDMMETYVRQFDVADDTKLPFGFTRPTLEQASKDIDRQVQGDARLEAAVTLRLDLWEEVRGNLITAHAALGNKSIAKRLTNTYYLRHMVMAYAKADYDKRTGSPTPGARMKPSSWYLMKRSVHEQDFSTRYIEADLQVMARMLVDIQIAQLLKFVADNYDIKPGLKRQAFRDNEDMVMDFLLDLTGDPEEAAARLRALGQKQAQAFERFGRLAVEGMLPDDEGVWENAIDIIANNYRGTLEGKEELGEEWDPSDRVPFTDEEMREVFRYASWLVTQDDPAALAAGMLFKGISEKRKAIKGMLGEEFATWKTLASGVEGYELWPRVPKQRFYTAYAVEEQIAQELMANLGEAIGIESQQLRNILAVGGTERQMVLPREVAKTLDEFGQSEHRSVARQMGRRLTTAWKWTVLNLPHRMVAFNVRHVTGQLEKTLALNPQALRFVDQAVRQLWPLVWKKKPPEPGTGLERWFERGGVRSSLTGIQLLGDINKLDFFQDIVKAVPGEESEAATRRALRFLTAPFKAYGRAMRDLTTFREAVLRFANFMAYEQQMRASPDGRPDNFGASIPEEVLALDDISDRAFKLSDEAVGSLDRVSVAARKASEVMLPFYRFTETNFSVWKQGMLNAIRDGVSGGGSSGAPPVDPPSGRGAGAEGSPEWWRRIRLAMLKSPFVAMRVMMFLLPILMEIAIIEAGWNRYWKRDEDDDVPSYVSLFHITLGRDSQGRVVYFPRIGSFSELTTWFGGFEGLQDHFRRVHYGLETLADAVEHIALEVPNKLLQELSPLIKVPIETVLGRQIFPKFWEPREIHSRWQHVLQSFPPGDVIARTATEGPRALTGLLGIEEGPAGNIEFAPGMKVMPQYKADYDEIRALATDYKVRVLGQPPPSYTVTERSDALRLRRAAMDAGDSLAAEGYLAQYISTYGADVDAAIRGYLDSVRDLDPLHGMKLVDQARFIAMLTPEDRQRLERAKTYYVTVLGGGQ